MDPLHTLTIDVKGGWVSSVLSEINDDLCCFLGVQSKVILCTPGCQLQDLFSVGCLITLGDEFDHCIVVCKLDDEIGIVGFSRWFSAEWRATEMASSVDLFARYANCLEGDDP